MTNVRRRIAQVCLLLAVFPGFQPISGHAQARSDHGPGDDAGGKVYRFVNGRWFDGSDFQRRTLYAVNGVFTAEAPARVDETIDLADGYVVPPFAEAHNHNLGSAYFLDRDQVRQTIQRYLAAGVFYVKTPANAAENAGILRSEFVNRVDSVEVSFSNDILTSRDGHPIGMTQAAFKEGGLPVPTAEELEGKGIRIIESRADLLAKWPRIAAARPDFIKTVLFQSEKFASRRADPTLFGFNGLDPGLLPHIVERAHAAGSRVSTHIMTAADFSVAVRAGVDEINHLPGLRFEPGTSETDYLISLQDAKRAAAQGCVVVTTAVVATLYGRDEALEALQVVQRKNLRLLKEEGVRLAIGSDLYTGTSVEEAMYLKALGVFGNAELLRMWSETAAQTIFPQRKIGRLREGYEASFIVLRGNPLESFEHVKDIQLRFKRGALIDR